jgi:hypothetical protein
LRLYPYRAKSLYPAAHRMCDDPQRLRVLWGGFQGHPASVVPLLIALWRGSQH